MKRTKIVKKKKKLEIVFDEKRRKEFLTGFHKRKNERRKRAQEEFQNKLKEERKRIKEEVRNKFQFMKKSYEPLREVTEADRLEEKEYEDDGVKVKIVELTASDQMLGANREESDSEANEAAVEVDDASVKENCVPGMDLVPVKRLPNTKSAPEPAKPSKISKLPTITSKRDLNRLVKNKTLNKMKNSKLFKKKELLDKSKHQKKVKRDKKTTLVNLPKHVRKKLKNEPSRYSKGRMLNRKAFRNKKQNINS